MVLFVKLMKYRTYKTSEKTECLYDADVINYVFTIIINTLLVTCVLGGVSTLLVPLHY